MEKQCGFFLQGSSRRLYEVEEILEFIIGKVKKITGKGDTTYLSLDRERILLGLNGTDENV